MPYAKNILSTAGLVAAPAVANATPDQGPTINYSIQWSIGDTNYTFQKVTLAPGASTGWHWTNGHGWELIQQGELTYYAADCATTVFRAGDTVEQAPGADEVHLGRNLGAVPLVVDIFFSYPAGSTPTVDAPNPGCDPL
jgi:quercetin dioxygenase-like cupin family protein